MKEIVFVTSNKGKIATASRELKNIKLVGCDANLIEPRSESLEEITKSKIEQAYELVKKPCIALDAGFYIESLKGWPSSFVNHELKYLGVEGIFKQMGGVSDRRAYFKECLAYFDGTNSPEYFYGTTKGRISNYISNNQNSKQWSDLWKIFIPNNCFKTMDEMTDEERQNRNDGHTSAIKEFNDWYNKQYVKKI